MIWGGGVTAFALIALDFCHFQGLSKMFVHLLEVPNGKEPLVKKGDQDLCHLQVFRDGCSSLKSCKWGKHLVGKEDRSESTNSKEMKIMIYFGASKHVEKAKIKQQGKIKAMV